MGLLSLPCRECRFDPAGGMDICLLRELCVVRWSLRRADYSSEGVLPTVVCRCVRYRNLNNQEALARVWSQRHRKKTAFITLETTRYIWQSWKLLMRLRAQKRKEWSTRSFYEMKYQMQKIQFSVTIFVQREASCTGRMSMGSCYPPAWKCFLPNSSRGKRRRRRRRRRKKEEEGGGGGGGGSSRKRKRKGKQ